MSIKLAEPKIIEKLGESDVNLIDIYQIDGCSIYDHETYGIAFSLIITNLKTSQSYSLLCNYRERISGRSKFGAFYQHIKSIVCEDWIGFVFRFESWQPKNRAIIPVKF